MIIRCFFAAHLAILLLACAFVADLLQGKVSSFWVSGVIIPLKYGIDERQGSRLWFASVKKSINVV